MLPDSSEPFVSFPFNIVMIVSLGLILARDHSLFHFFSACAFLCQLYLTLLLQKHRGGEDEAWRWIFRLSVVEYLSEAGEYRVVWLAQSVVSTLCSCFVLRAIWQVLSTCTGTTAVGNRLKVGTFLGAWLGFYALACHPQDETGISMSDDWSLLIYLHLSRAAESARMAIQVVYLLSCTFPASELYLKFHMILCNNLLSKYSTANSVAYIDMYLQIVLMAFTCIYPLFYGQQVINDPIEEPQPPEVDPIHNWLEAPQRGGGPTLHELPARHPLHLNVQHAPVEDVCIFPQAVQATERNWPFNMQMVISGQHPISVTIQQTSVHNNFHHPFSVATGSTTGWLAFPAQDNTIVANMQYQQPQTQMYFPLQPNVDAEQEFGANDNDKLAT
jgi:hypothetical protein